VLFVGARLGTGVTALWSECARLLPDDVLVLGWDLPGHGASRPHDEATTVADLAAAVVTMLDELTDQGEIPRGLPVHYAGVSLNGAVALQLALDHADRHSYARLCEALAGFDMRSRLGELTLPVLTIHGDQDAVTPPSAGGEIATGAPEGTVRQLALPTVAHQAPLEAPQEVAEALDRMMADTRR